MTRDEAASDDPTGDEIRVGISTCLLGENVRYDGGHKHDVFLTETVGRFVRFVPVCPEVEMGLGVPRKTLRLEQHGKGEGSVRLVEPDTATDRTDQMAAYAAKKLRALEALDLSGYVLKSKSPSCGMERVKLYRGAMANKEGVGLFAKALLERFPHLPVEEDGRLHDPLLRENFFERVFAYRRLKSLSAGRFSVGRLVAFHAAEKLLLLAHDPEAYRSLGRLVANAKKTEGALDRYRGAFLAAMAKKATRGRHANVLQHMAGYFKDTLGKDEKLELAQTIADYRAGLLPLIVPITLLRHLVRRHRVEYLASQSYLNPHPKELMLRNHV
jgi:uncharacterized protein YbgA (DUF1722 family)/uncharacterized protein YbbK (DUF523 family)